MTFLDCLLIVNILLALVGSIVNFSYVLTPQRRKSKKPVRLFAAIALIYFVAVYLLPLTNLVNESLFLAGLIRGGVFVLICLLIADVIVDWRTQK